MSTTAPPVLPLHVIQFIQADYDVRLCMKEMHGINWPTAAEYGERDHNRSTWTKDTYEYLTRRLEVLLFVIELHSVQPEDKKWVKEAYFEVFRIGGGFPGVVARLHHRMVMYRLVTITKDASVHQMINLGRYIWESGDTP